MKLIILNTDDKQVMDKLYPHYLSYEAEISNALIEEIFNPKKPEENYQYFKDYFNRGIKTILCMKEENIVGFISYHIVTHNNPGYVEGYLDWAHLAEIYIQSDYRNLGIGKLLVKEIESLCLKEGFNKIHLTDIVGNSKFWKGLGYEDTNRYEPNEGGLIYEKTLI